MSTNTLDELVQALGSIADMTACNTLVLIYQSLFTRSFTTMNWCQGVLIKNADGSLTYQTQSGEEFRFTAATDPAELYKFPAVKLAWDRMFPDAFVARRINQLADKLRFEIANGPVPEASDAVTDCQVRFNSLDTVLAEIKAAVTK